MGGFEPDTTLAQCAATFPTEEKRKKFISKWKLNVDRRSKTWEANRDNQSKNPHQILWTAHIAEFLNATAEATRSPQGIDFSVALHPAWPMPGPLFDPPTFLHASKRNPTPEVNAEDTYLKPVHAVHYAYYSMLRRCPNCGATGKAVQFGGWNATGPREIHGLSREEMAIGIQVRCTSCEEKASKMGGAKDEASYCFSTTSAKFWEQYKFWELPSGLPVFSSRSGVTSELFNLIIEFRPAMTSAGLAERIKQMHLLEYHKQQLLYLTNFETRWRQNALFKPVKGLVRYSKPLTGKVKKHTGGYDNRSISDEMITDIFVRYCEKTRIQESEENVRSQTAMSLSLDTTFRAAYKATLVDKNKARVRSHKGGIVNAISHIGTTMGWRFCLSGALAETKALLEGIRSRHIIASVAHPAVLTVDNCCFMKNMVAVGYPEVEVRLDLWHFMMRYLICVVGGSKSPHRGAIARDVVDAIVRSHAIEGRPAVHRAKEEQEERLEEMYEKWDKHGASGVLQRKAVHPLHSTYGSHHIHLVNACAKKWNKLVDLLKASGPQPMHVNYVVEFNPPDTGEHFGLVKMNLETAAQYSLSSVKQEPADDLIDLTSQDLLDPSRILAELGIDPALLHALPLSPTPETSGSQLSADAKGKGVMRDPPASATALKRARQDEQDGIQVLTHSEWITSLAAATEASPLGTSVSTTIASSTSSQSQSVTLTNVPLGMAAASTTASVTPSESTVEHQAQPPAPVAAVATPGSDSTSRAVKKSRLHVPGTPAPLKRTRAPEQSTPSIPQQSAQPQLIPQQPVVQPAPATTNAFFGQHFGQHQPAATVTPSNEPILPHPIIAGLTRSQKVFSIATGIDPRVLTFSKNTSWREFELFMKLRDTHKWVTYKMTPFHFVCAASTYNAAISQINQTGGEQFPLKTPRAILEKLGDIEAQIFVHVRDNNFESKSGGTAFWTRHCNAVSLGSKFDDMLKQLGKNKSRKNHTCGRCKAIMYPEPKKHADINHPRNICRDGVRQSPQDVGDIVINGQHRNITEQPPPYPQPEGIFTEGKTFHVAPFMAAVQGLYDRIVVNDGTSGALAMYDFAFACLLKDRMIIVPGLDGRPSKALFKLYHGLELDLGGNVRLDQHEGELCLRLDCLEEPPLELLPAWAAQAGL
ncbi:hypothetical protein LXA43DRAFT_1103634 [Ganoderma leucocontextum]|nr:hypothetical protein LXA43DRAFT_1103634 [Ganoderma leucocontextum]